MKRESQAVEIGAGRERKVVWASGLGVGGRLLDEETSGD